MGTVSYIIIAAAALLVVWLFFYFVPLGLWISALAAGVPVGACAAGVTGAHQSPRFIDQQKDIAPR